MPTLHWIGKEKVINHHRDVPFRILEHQYGYTTEAETNSPTDSGNKIIHGDNLEALKSLLPQYEGKIKCIYIDPPYNTGNENWVYNDNVNHPKIKKWLGEVVGKEGDDLSRHDKWLCMMYPRLQLLHKLLAEDGAIFISIGDDEISHLNNICDEVFGVGNRCGIVSRVMKSGGNKGNFFSPNIDYILVYAKNRANLEPFKAKLDEKIIKKLYNNIEKDGERKGEKYRAFGLYQSSLDARPNQRYYIECPDGTLVIPPGGTFPEKAKDAEKILPNQGDGCWRWSQERYILERKKGNIVFKKSSQGVLVTSDKLASKWNVYTKIWLKNRENEGQTPKNIIAEFENRHSAKELKNLGISFIYSKPKQLIEYLISILTKDKNTIVLDSFAGSGTTAHAVLNLNKADGGNRKFILIEMEDYANDITAERVKRVMQGYGEGKKAVEGTGGSFDYYELGAPLFHPDNNLNEAVGTAKIREYVWYTETKTTMRDTAPAHPYLLGNHDDTAYYFYYEPERLTTLHHEFLASITDPAEQYIIYADNCLLTEEFMTQNRIIFKKIPRDITRF